MPRVRHPKIAFALLLGFVAACKTTPPPPDDLALIEKGRQLFFNETFNGNGRTCGTCHRAAANFSINPAFIATLPPIMGSEDFSYFANTVPGFFYRLGMVKAGTRSGDHHTPTFLADDSCLAVGMKAMSLLALDYLDRHR